MQDRAPAATATLLDRNDSNSRRIDNPAGHASRATQPIVVTDADHLRLREMMASLRTVGNPFRAYLRRLKRELDTAAVLPAANVDVDVVTMNAHLRVRDLDSGEAQLLSLVFHGDADLFGARLSVLSPLGTELLGRRVGDVIEWDSTAGIRRLMVERILYQPEAAGHFHL